MPLALRTSLELEGCPREEGKPRPSLARVAGIIATMPVAIFGHFGHFRPFLGKSKAYLRYFSGISNDISINISSHILGMLSQVYIMHISGISPTHLWQITGKSQPYLR